MSSSSFIVEVPTLFTKTTQIASRCGNTILTGNERIQGNMVINGSLTLDGTVNDTTIKFNDLDISNLIVHGNSTLNTLTVTSAFVVENESQLNGALSVAGRLNVAGPTSLSDLSCNYLQVNEEFILNDVSINGKLVVVDDSRLDSLFCNTLYVYNDSTLNLVNINTLTVSNHTSLDSISCETLNVNGPTSLSDLSCNYLQVNEESILNDVSINGKLVVVDDSRLDSLFCNTLEVYDDSSLNIVNINTLTVSNHTSLDSISCETLNVNGHTSLSDLSCNYLQVNEESILNDVSINGKLVVVDDSRLDSLFCNTLEVYDDSSLNIVNINSLTVSKHTLLDSISCEILEVNDISVNYAYMNDISCLYLDVSNSLILNGSLIVNGPTILQNISGQELSCKSLNVKEHTLFQNSISYQNADRSLLTTDMSAILWIVAGESVGRLDLSHNINHFDVREGNIFGKKYWAAKNGGYLEVENVYIDTTVWTGWTISLAFGVVNPYKSGTLFYDNSNDIIKLNGPNLYVYEDSNSIIIPSFSVLTIVRLYSSYIVYINGIQEYISTVNEYNIITNSLNFISDTVGIQLLAAAFWDRMLNVSEIEELTLEVLT